MSFNVSSWVFLIILSRSCGLMDDVAFICEGMIEWLLKHILHECVVLALFS